MNKLIDSYINNRRKYHCDGNMQYIVIRRINNNIHTTYVR